MGVGLYVAKQLIEAHQGRVWVESEGEGLGSTFFIELPEWKGQEIVNKWLNGQVIKWQTKIWPRIEVLPYFIISQPSGQFRLRLYFEVIRDFWKTSNGVWQGFYKV